MGSRMFLVVCLGILVGICCAQNLFRIGAQVAQRTIMQAVKTSFQQGVKNIPRYGVQGVVAGGVGTGVGIGISEAFQKGQIQAEAENDKRVPIHYFPHDLHKGSSAIVSSTGPEVWVVAALALMAALLALAVGIILLQCFMKKGGVEHAVRFDGNDCFIETLQKNGKESRGNAPMNMLEVACGREMGKQAVGSTRKKVSRKGHELIMV